MGKRKLHVLILIFTRTNIYHGRKSDIIIQQRSDPRR